MNIRPSIELANLSDIGCQRTENEDNYCYAEPEDDEEFHHKGRLIAVADGMGGHEGGQVASALAAHAVWDTFLHGDAMDPVSTLAAAFGAAQQAIRDYAEEHPEFHNMGTTCTCAILRQGELFYGHVGDSRLYLLRNGTISCLTRDHTYVQRMIDEGTITAAQAKDHPSKGVLTSALGGSSSVAADFSDAPVTVEPGDILLLCTDGLHGLVSDEELLTLAMQNVPREACRKLVEAAKERGGHDNITVQIVRIGETSVAPGNGLGGH
jgi:PPM family protein phosphatase